MDHEEMMLQRWKAAVNDTSREAWTAEHMAGFFQYFRPDGAGLEKVFEDVEGGDEIVARLLEIYEATSAGSTSETEEDGYFVVRNPSPIHAARAEELVRRHRDFVAAMARVLGRDEDASALECSLSVEVTEGEAPWPPDEDDPETAVYETIGDFMRSLIPRESDASLMEEAFYTIACDYNLQYYCLWPLYREESTIEEPFKPYVDLWKHGVTFRFEGFESIRVFVPEGKLLH